MDHIRVEREGHVLQVLLARGKANALVAPMVEELAHAVDLAASEDSVRALVLGSASTRMFCGGFDVHEVFGYDRAAMSGFFGRFMHLFEHIRTLPKPVVGALTGPAFAGGAILALACDLRVMAPGVCIAVNEVDLGVMLPARMLRAMAAAGPHHVMRSMLMGGEALSSERALAAGLVTELVPPSDVVAVATSRARQLGDKPPHAFAAHKRALDPVGPMSADDAAAGVEEVIDCWFGDEARARRDALIAKLAARPR